MSFSEVEIHAQFTLNQGRIEEITMKEDIITNNFIGDDGFGDMFEGDLEPELARAGTVLDDEPLYQSNDISKISTIDDGQPRTIIDSTLERSKLGTDIKIQSVASYHLGFQKYLWSAFCIGAEFRCTRFCSFFQVLTHAACLKCHNV